MGTTREQRVEEGLRATCVTGQSRCAPASTTVPQSPCIHDPEALQTTSFWVSVDASLPSRTGQISGCCWLIRPPPPAVGDGTGVLPATGSPLGGAQMPLTNKQRTPTVSQCSGGGKDLGNLCGTGQRPDLWSRAPRCGGSPLGREPGIWRTEDSAGGQGSSGRGAEGRAGRSQGASWRTVLGPRASLPATGTGGRWGGWEPCTG